MPVFQLQHGTAWTIRMQVFSGIGECGQRPRHRTWLWYDATERKSSALLVWGKREGSTQVAQKRKHKFSVGERRPNAKT
jgi:hypothetical protein